MRNRIGSIPARIVIRATVQVPADRVKQELTRYVSVTPINEASCAVSISASSLDWASYYLGAIGAPLTVHGPPEAVEHIRHWGERVIAGTERAVAVGAC